MAAIFKRETKSYYTGMVGYVTAAVSLFFLGLYFTNRNLMYASSDFASVLYTTTLIMLFLLPAISMRSFAEDRRNKTDQLLLTSPVSIPGIVLGKFLAEVVVFALPLTVAVIMPLILTAFGTVSLVSAFSALFAYLLLGAACLAVGTWISALTENQIIAAVAGVAALLLAYMMPSLRNLFTAGSAVALALFTVIAAVLSVVAGLRTRSFTLGCLTFAGCCVVLTALFLLQSSWLTEAFSAVLSALCLFTPFEEFVNNSFSIPTLVYYLTVIVLFLFFTAQGLEKRRWN